MEQLIRQWAIERDLHNSRPLTQLAKVVEELGELSSALSNQDQGVYDGIGDVYVTLVILAQIHNTTIEECFNTVYGERGHLSVEEEIRQSAWEEGLHLQYPLNQLPKVYEGLGETSSAITKNKGKLAVKEGIGKTYLELVVLAQTIETTVDFCAKLAYEEIKDRIGITIDGSFIKSDDLANYHYHTSGQGD